MRYYRYPTIPRKEEIVENLMTEISKNNRDIIDILIDCDKWYFSEHKERLISPDLLQAISIYMRIKYQKLETWAKNEITEYNRLTTTKSNKDSKIDRVFGHC